MPNGLTDRLNIYPYLSIPLHTSKGPSSKQSDEAMETLDKG
jgi:hypothetical protein